MTVTDVAFGSTWPERRPPRWMTAAFALAIAVWGLVALAVYFSGSGTYAAVARESGFAETEFLYPPGDAAARPRRVDLPILIDWHERWTAYVLGRSADPLRGAAEPAFTAEEVSHMADVRTVFVGAQAAMYAALGSAIVLFGFALRRGPRAALLLLRDGALASGAAVLAVAVVAALAFEPAFLVFHLVFFPQGNFLFPPTSNLIRLYPEPYWYGVTIRIGAAFVVAAGAVTLAATAALRAPRMR